MQAQRIRIGTREFRLPASRSARIGVGWLFVAGGTLGFLPILGFWMIPFGLVILSKDVAKIRRGRRRAAVWWGRRRSAPRRRSHENVDQDGSRNPR